MFFSFYPPWSLSFILQGEGRSRLERPKIKIDLDLDGVLLVFMSAGTYQLRVFQELQISIGQPPSSPILTHNHLKVSILKVNHGGFSLCHLSFQVGREVLYPKMVLNNFIISSLFWGSHTTSIAMLKLARIVINTYGRASFTSICLRRTWKSFATRSTRKICKSQLVYIGLGELDILVVLWVAKPSSTSYTCDSCILHVVGLVTTCKVDVSKMDSSRN